MGSKCQKRSVLWFIHFLLSSSFLHFWDSIYFQPLWFEGFGFTILNDDGFVLSLLPRERTFAKKGREELNHLELDKIHLLWLTLKSSFRGFKALNQIIRKHNICVFLASSVNEVAEKEHFWVFKEYIQNIAVLDNLVQECSIVFVFQSKSGTFWNGVLKTLLALKVISVRSKTDCCARVLKTSDFVYVLLRSVMDEVSVSQVQQNILVGVPQKFQAKKHCQVQHVMSFSHPSILGYPWNRCGIAPWRKSVPGPKEKFPAGWAGEQWSCSQPDTRAVCSHHLEGGLCREFLSGVSGGIWPFCGSHRLVLHVAGASSSTPPDTAPPPAHGEDRGRGNHSGVTRGLANW